MAQRESLNEKQLAVLRWVGDGCPDAVMEDYSHQISAASLRGRGFVTTSGRGPTWQTEITAAGRGYLDLAASKPPTPRQASTSVTEQLVRRLIAPGGSLRLPRSTTTTVAVSITRTARLAERSGKVPECKRLAIRAVFRDALQVALVDAPEGAIRGTSPVPVPNRVSRYPPGRKGVQAAG